MYFDTVFCNPVLCRGYLIKQIVRDEKMKRNTKQAIRKTVFQHDYIFESAFNTIEWIEFENRYYSIDWTLMLKSLQFFTGTNADEYQI